MHYEFKTGTVRSYYADNDNNAAHIRAMVARAISGKAEFSVRRYTQDGSYRVIAAGWTKANGEYTYSRDAWLQ
jgi:uncharacterized cupin superfamily protein